MVIAHLKSNYGHLSNVLHEESCRNAAISGLQLQLKDAYHKVDET
jgi:hypothetical protein